MSKKFWQKLLDVALGRGFVVQSEHSELLSVCISTTAEQRAVKLMQIRRSCLVTLCATVNSKAVNMKHDKAVMCIISYQSTALMLQLVLEKRPCREMRLRTLGKQELVTGN